MKQDAPTAAAENQPSDSDSPTSSRGVPRAYMFLFAVVLLVAGAWGYRAITSAESITETSATGADRVAAPAFLSEEEIDRLIAAYESRIVEHTDSSDYRILGSLYLEKGRLTGDVTRYLAAAEAYETASELFPSDPVAVVGEASAAYALHDFETAASEASRVYDATGRVDSLAILFDAALALGDYEAASTYLDVLKTVTSESPAVMVRSAEWSRLTGDAESARSFAMEALAGVEDSPNQRLRSWYRSFAAQMMLELGEYEPGLESARTAVEEDPESRVASITLARLLAAVGETELAIETYREITEATPEPEVLAELSSLLLAADRDDEAEEVFATLQVVGDLAKSEGVYDRAIAQHLADHGIEPERAVAIARSELEVRQDVGAYDTLAWALYAAGQYEEASDMMNRALMLDTVDAEFQYHAGMIAAALKDERTAIVRLEDALTLSPSFDPLQSKLARATLEDLR